MEEMCGTISTAGTSWLDEKWFPLWHEGCCLQPKT